MNRNVNQLKNMLNIKILENSWFFETLELKDWELIFDEWEIDNNLYIIKSWEINIEKYTTTEKKETKLLATLKKLEFFWEWSLNNKEPKEVRVSSSWNSIILKIDARKKIQDFMKKYPSEWLDLLKYIIEISNKRLLKSNSLITSTYEMNKTISSLKKINNKAFFELIIKFEKILGSEYIIYLEKNPVMEDYAKIKYDTREANKMIDETIELDKKQLNLEKLQNLEKYNFIETLNIADTILWYLVIWKKTEDFSENEIKIIKSISNSLSWIIRQKEFFEEERNKQFIKED